MQEAVWEFFEWLSLLNVSAAILVAVVTAAAVLALIGLLNLGLEYLWPEEREMNDEG